ncbi:MAG: efflux RND transporter permease subunit [Pseudomonadales bacterium]|nr:efflux RND transporter permease subunit [Pseudomonadales bacterium]
MNGLIAWFVKNPVAANLLMLLIMGSGLYSVTNLVPLEVFPDFAINSVNISVTHRAASPERIEEGISIPIEEAIYDLEGIDKLNSRSSEGSSFVRVEIDSQYDRRELLNDIKNRVDAVNKLPQDSDRPKVTLSEHRREVISVVVSGDLTEKEMRGWGETVRDNLTRLPGVTQVQLDSVRPYEISIEIPESVLREYHISLEEVARAIEQGTVDLSAGNIRTQNAEILVRTKGQAYGKSDFENIVVLTQPNGTRLTLKDLGKVVDGFEENQVTVRFNNRAAVLIEVYRVGDQSAIEVANVVKDYVEMMEEKLPVGIKIETWRDRSKVVKARLNTLTRSAIQGGILVFLLLALFLRPIVAVWVCVGIPISFMGGLAMMPVMGVTLNLISLFAFILVLGIVVDDAIVTGENIYAHFQREGVAEAAVITGTQEVWVPVTFGVLTTVAAFLPLAFIDGFRGAIFLQLPLIVIPVLLFSLVESKWILPAHLRHLKPLPHSATQKFGITQLQQKVANGLESGIKRYYQPLLERALSYRYATLALFFGVSLVVLAVIMSGWSRFVFFPRVESETARVSLTMPVGTDFRITDASIQKMMVAAQALQKQYVDDNGDSVIKNILSITGHGGGNSAGQTNKGRVMFEIVAPEERTMDVTSTQLVREWRKKVGDVPGAESVNYRAEFGRGGDPIDIQLRGPDFEKLRDLANALKQELALFPSVFDIADTFSDGKKELQLKLKPEANFYGFTLFDIISQVRRANYGLEVQRIQRGREDIRVMLRYPPKERASRNQLEKMLIRTAGGAEVPLHDLVEIKHAKGPSSIKRIDRSRTVNVTADVNKDVANMGAIKKAMEQRMEELLLQYPNIEYSLEGEVREERESFHSLLWGFVAVLFIIYCLLAIPFRSYSQPLIIMSIIPFGAAGAVIGHWIMGMDLTIMSMMGMLALTGVVVNDSLVLVDYINKQLIAGRSLLEAVRIAGVARFRPVLLTSLTTFVGLMPLIFEKSTQAQFLIPMAVSLGFGVMIATAVTLILVPVNYLILKDIQSGLSKGIARLGSVKSVFR